MRWFARARRADSMIYEVDFKVGMLLIHHTGDHDMTMLWEMKGGPGDLAWKTRYLRTSRAPVRWTERRERSKPLRGSADTSVV
jgi:hypothetical protein